MIGLGSNLGDRQKFLAAAVQDLRKTPGLQVLAISPVYESPPWGGPPQDDYLNAATLLHSVLAPAQLLETALNIEQRHGRIRTCRNGPRTLDLDVLWIRDEVVATAELTVPHPRLLERPFALVPLLDVVPDAIDPRSGRSLSSSLACLDRSGLMAWGDVERGNEGVHRVSRLW